MKKTTKKGLMIVVAVALVFSLSTVVAFAATNTSSIEELFLAFRTAQAEAAVESGDMTAEQAEEYLENLTAAMEESDDDAVPPLQMGRGLRGMRAGMGSIGTIALYADLAGIEEDDIRAAMEEDGTTVFQMADDAGLLDALKDAMLDAESERIDDLLEAGNITDEQAADMLEHCEESIGSITADSALGSRGGNMSSGGGRQGRADKPECDGSCDEA